MLENNVQGIGGVPEGRRHADMPLTRSASCSRFLRQCEYRIGNLVHPSFALVSS